MEQVVLAILAVVGALAVGTAFIFAFSRRNNDLHRSARLAIFAAVVTFVAATAGFIIATRIFYFDASRHAPSPSGIQVIVTLQTYNPQTNLFSLDGSIRGLKPEQEIWLVFRSAQRDLPFPAPAPCNIFSENLFSCQRILTGTPGPATPNVKGFLVAAVPKAAAVFRKYNSGSLGTAGLHDLPDGAILISKVCLGS
jgi:hypothetical protein